MPPGEAFWNFSGAADVRAERRIRRRGSRGVCGAPPAFVYQRYSLNNYAGTPHRAAPRRAVRARIQRVRNLDGAALGPAAQARGAVAADRTAQSAAADLIVVVSRAMRDEIVARGVDADRQCSVNPNGVDPDRYRPDVDGQRGSRALRPARRSSVIGFIGTFGPWHGAEVLARAFVACCDDRRAACAWSSAPADDRRRREDAGRARRFFEQGARRRSLVSYRPGAAGRGP